MHHATPTLGIALLLSAGAALAQPTIYRCGNSYGTQPCAGATVVEGQASAKTSDVAQARRAMESDARRADALEKARLEREKAAPRAIVIGPVAQATPADKEKDKEKETAGKKPAEFKLAGPKPPKPPKAKAKK